MCLPNLDVDAAFQPVALLILSKSLMVSNRVLWFTFRTTDLSRHILCLAHGKVKSGQESSFFVFKTPADNGFRPDRRKRYDDRDNGYRFGNPRR